MNGVVVTYETMPAPWKSWLYWNNPVTYYIKATLGSVLHGQEVVCRPSEFQTFQSPPEQSCGNYASGALLSGYIDNPGESGTCRYCQFGVGDEFAVSPGSSISVLSITSNTVAKDSVNASYDFRWQSIGILGGFCISSKPDSYLSSRSSVSDTQRSLQTSSFATCSFTFSKSKAGHSSRVLSSTTSRNQSSLGSAERKISW